VQHRFDPAECLSGTVELPVTPRTMDRAPSHGPRCAMHCWHITLFASTASCTMHHVPRTLGIQCCRCALCIVPYAFKFTIHHHHTSSQIPPAHCQCTQARVDVPYDTILQQDNRSMLVHMVHPLLVLFLLLLRSFLLWMNPGQRARLILLPVS
jgi:hypothetical protein